jgi:hypothetical protein
VPVGSIGGQTYHPWKAKYGGLDVSEARRLKQHEDENRRLKHLVAGLMKRWSRWVKSARPLVHGRLT